MIRFLILIGFALSFALSFGLGVPNAQVQKVAPWKDGDSISCVSPASLVFRANFKMTVIKANWRVPEQGVGGVGTSLMQIEGQVFEGEKLIHEFSNVPFSGYWPMVDGTRYEFFFGEGWPQVTYFIARFDLANGPIFEDGFAHFYDTGTQDFSNLTCRTDFQ